MLTWYTSSMADQEAMERAGEVTAVKPVRDGVRLVISLRGEFE